MSNKLLALDDAPEVTLFRKVEQVLKADPELSRVVREWLTWDGEAADFGPIPTAAPVAIRLSPAIGATGWESPDAMESILILNLDAQVESPNVDDALNVCHAARRAFYPTQLADPLSAVQQGLRDAGARTGQPEFAGPSIAPVGPEGADEASARAFAARIQIKFRVQLNLNS